MEAPARVHQGAPVPLVFTVKNVGTESVTLQLLGRNPTADFRVSDLKGRLIWSRLRGQTLLGALRLFPLDAGKSLSFREIWDQRSDAERQVAPGEYLVQGELLTDVRGRLASSPVRVRITP
jgi:hypothetical protein